MRHYSVTYYHLISSHINRSISLCIKVKREERILIKLFLHSYIQGIYRVSGVKSKVEHLCQKFDLDPASVDLEDVHPNIISNVLKLYLRQVSGT